MTRLFTFGKKERLTLRERIEELFSEGRSFSISPLKVLYLVAEGKDIPVQVLISIPKKKFRHAADRNRLRRKIRESYRLHKQMLGELTKTLTGTLYLGFIYTGSEDIPYAEMEVKMVHCLERLQQLKQAGIDIQQKL